MFLFEEEPLGYGLTQWEPVCWPAACMLACMCMCTHTHTCLAAGACVGVWRERTGVCAEGEGGSVCGGC